jgi:hypothetical protein
VFWPYRPRQGFPATPRWLTVVLLVAVAAAYVIVLELAFGHDPTSGMEPGP